MHYPKIILFLLMFILGSCGKPPIFNKMKKEFTEFSGKVYLERDIEFTFKWIVSPTLSEMSSFEISLKEPLAQEISVHAYIDMPEMGHGSSPIEIKALSETNYSFTEVSFFMTGLWVLHIEFFDNGLRVDKWQKSIIL